MEKVLNFRTLNADEIECRVGSVSEGKGCSLLMYKNARVDMQLLDEVVGCENWERSHELINGNLFCTVSVFCDGRWVRKQDVGTESNTEKEKGQASDAFKRACVNFGIGRELYTCPFVWVNLAENEWRTGYNGKRQPNVRFNVAAIEYDEQRHVSYLLIKDDRDKIRFVFGKSKNEKDGDKKNEKDGDKKNEDARLEAIDQVKRTKSRDELGQVYNLYSALHNDPIFVSACTEQAKKFKQ